MKDYLQLIDTTTTPRCDVTPLFANPKAFAELVADLAAPLASTPIDYVAGIDALGFILGVAIATRLDKGFIPIRKGGKLPGGVRSIQFVDYSGETKSLEIRKRILHPTAKVLVVDEWIETGTQMQAAITLIEQEGGSIAGIATINIDKSPISEQLCERYKCHTIWSNMDS